MYDYREIEKADIYTALGERFDELFEDVTAEALKVDAYEVADKIADELFNCDSVTGNASGSYFFNKWEARDAVIDNISLLREMCFAWNYDNEIADMFLSDDWESMDVMLRCYLLHEIMCEVMEEVRDAIEGIEDEEMIDAYALADRITK